ncbi:hypothetical protein [Aquibacillus salsiterrae]|uniref:Uncharacterized protein n=1 Tax=Aquibacillus salsiterrae TaxID=2950439 RepID=A0A9X3WE76_9BACI|nr:hypothetical protein [Aquibacillus salsiterrae]MDC3417093.1 hypothetical protein [Aquibacillus salsiterrae]
MVFELVTEIGTEWSPLYIYLTYMITIVSAYGFYHSKQFNMNKNSTIQLKSKTALLIIDALQNDLDQVINIYQAWIAKMMKHKDAPDDDADNQFSLFLRRPRIKLGGVTWLKPLYSPRKLTLF